MKTAQNTNLKSGGGSKYPLLVKLTNPKTRDKKLNRL